MKTHRADFAAQRERYLKCVAERRCVQCKQPNDSTTMTTCNACRMKRQVLAQRRRAHEATRLKARRHARREAILEHYGSSCALCGSTESLELDHVNNDGREHRQLTGGTSDRTYWWVIKNGFPAGFQILCQPCNLNKWLSRAT